MQKEKKLEQSNIEIMSSNFIKKKDHKLVFFGASSALEKKWSQLQKLNIIPDFICDNDKNKHGKYFKKYKIYSPDEILCKSVKFNILITSSFIKEIKKQLKVYKNINKIYDLSNVFHQIQKIDFDKISNDFIDYHTNKTLNTKLKTIAFYLPQFHPFPENDKWWGKGFTEWTNVTKATPNFLGHYQPHLPIHNGFYDLRIPEVMIEQAKLARNYGIYGFNFYYYWFDGKILMHKPFEILLQHKEIDINFCITWANENWTRRWDGEENEVLIEQKHSFDDSKKFLESLYKFFDDNRYIRIRNKPVLIIYRADIIPEIKNTINMWRDKVKKDGYDGLYLICCQTFGITNPLEFGFDAAMQFPPHTVSSSSIFETIEITNHNFYGSVFDYTEVVNNAIKIDEPKYKLYRTAMLSWDNTARRQNFSTTFHKFSLLKYKQWISNISINLYNNDKYEDEEKFIFINAWNEWAEGTHLEPDRKFGYGYLQATYSVLSNFRRKYDKVLNKPIIKLNNIAIILHIHYTDLWNYIEKYLTNISNYSFDLYITLTNTDNNIVENIIKCYPLANITIVENRGRDILPFIDTYRRIKKLNYDFICKLHSKKSIYRNDGKEIRDELYKELLDDITKIINLFESNSNIGLIASQKYLIKHTKHNMTYCKKNIKDLSVVLDLHFKYNKFPAGSMFWFKPEALDGIDKISSKFFDTEEGLVDGTIAHTIERLFCLIVTNNKFLIKGINKV